MRVLLVLCLLRCINSMITFGEPWIDSFSMIDRVAFSASWNIPGFTGVHLHNLNILLNTMIHLFYLWTMPSEKRLIMTIVTALSLYWEAYIWWCIQWMFWSSVDGCNVWYALRSLKYLEPLSTSSCLNSHHGLHTTESSSSLLPHQVSSHQCLQFY